MKRVLVAMAVIAALLVGFSGIGYGAEAKHFEGIRIRYFVGGDPGCPFGSVVYKGALAAEKDLGCDVDFVFSGWNSDKMVSQFRDAVAARPDGIAMMGHPGYDALTELVDEAYQQGISVTFQNVDVPQSREKYVYAGYVGQQLYESGYNLGIEAVRRFDLKAGDRAAVEGPWEQPYRTFREKGVADAFEESGLVVDRISRVHEWTMDPTLMVPTFAGYILNNPDVKIIEAQALRGAKLVMGAVGKKPGEIKWIGFDIDPGIIDGFREGYIQLTLDQQPYLQGYLPILNLCMSIKYGFAGLFIDTGGGFVDESNYEAVAELAAEGYR